MTITVNEKPIWVTWESQVRNKTLSKEIGAELYQLDSKAPRLVRYLQLLISTFNLFRKTNSEIVIVQNPSIILAFFSNIFCRIFNKKLAIDAHNGGLFPLDGKYRLLNILAKVVVKISPLTIVSNDELKKYVESKGGRAIVVPDPLPDLNPEPNFQSNNVYKVVFVCTWASDEPFNEVIKASRNVPENVELYITGNHKGKAIIDKSLASRLFLTGYISDLEYVELINSADVTIDLTTRDNCLVCGAYESVALEKPMILSNKKALRKYFKKGALYAENNADDIAKKIVESMEVNDTLKQEIMDLKIELTYQWLKIRQDFIERLNQL